MSITSASLPGYVPAWNTYDGLCLTTPNTLSSLTKKKFTFAGSLLPFIEWTATSSM